MKYLFSTDQYESNNENKEFNEVEINGKEIDSETSKYDDEIYKTLLLFHLKYTELISDREDLNDGNLDEFKIGYSMHKILIDIYSRYCMKNENLDDSKSEELEETLEDEELEDEKRTEILSIIKFLIDRLVIYVETPELLKNYNLEEIEGERDDINYFIFLLNQYIITDPDLTNDILIVKEGLKLYSMLDNDFVKKEATKLKNKYGEFESMDILINSISDKNLTVEISSLSKSLPSEEVISKMTTEDYQSLYNIFNYIIEEISFNV